MSQFVLVRHKVRDFNAWKVGFDAHAPKRAEAGLSDRQLLRSSDDANEVVILLEAKDLSRAKSFIASPDLRETMEKFGVADKPDVHFLNE
jgi:hypothetical protein